MEKIFKNCVLETQKTYQFEDGQKEEFVKTLSQQCNRKGIFADKTKIFIKEKYNFNDEVVSNIINKEYQNKKDFGIDTKKSMEDYLNEKYDFRYNEVLSKVEYKLKPSKNFLPIDDYKLNSICRELEKEEYKTSTDKVFKLLISDFVPVYNPFKEYFNQLPKWDGKDYISEFSNLVKTDDTNFWNDAFKRWLVAMVGCALIDKAINQSIIVLNGSQGIGKSTFIERILPPELEKYKYSGLIRPNDKDTLIMMTENILIDLDELASLNRKEEKSIKEIISKTKIKIRKPYGRVNEEMPRRASFIGSVNDPEFLMDLTGSRRFLCFEIFGIDNFSSVNYVGIYSQAFHLYKNGFKYWFDGEEITEINYRNEKYMMKDPIEHFVLSKYKSCKKEDATNFLTATEILLELKKDNNLSLDTTTNTMIGKVLKKSGFIRTKKDDVYKYAVQHC